MSNDDLFKIPRVPNGKQKKSAKKSPKKPKIEPGTLQNGLQSTSNRGRKRFVPIALKTCSQCGQEFADHAGWSKKVKRPGAQRAGRFKICTFSSQKNKKKQGEAFFRPMYKRL